jgi:hypothetical protein
MTGLLGEIAGPQAVAVRAGVDLADLALRLKKAGYVARLERGRARARAQGESGGEDG